MPFEKFDQHTEGEYWKKYFEKDKVFYNAIREHLSRALTQTPDSAGLDIGSGPGVGAKLLDDLGIETALIGYEPSMTAVDGIKLSKELESKSSKVKYTPVQGGIDKIPTPEIDSLDYFLILRAAHEIAESLGGHDKFFSELERIMAGLKRSGKIIIAEPQYDINFNDQTEIIERVRKFKQIKIGHSHIPSDYITDEEMSAFMSQKSFQKVEESIIADQSTLDELRLQEIDIEKSPCYFYVHTYQREEVDDKKHG